MVKVPRVPTCDWMKLVTKFLRTATNRGVEQFHNEGRLRELGFEPMVLTGKPGVDAEAFSLLQEAMRKEAPPAQLGISMDQEQSQLTGTSWLQHLGLTVEGLHDPQHRSHNDCENAVCSAGLKDKYHAGVLLCNVLFGPYNKAAFFHHVLQEGRNHCKRLQPDGAWLVKFWPRINRDRGWQDRMDVMSTAARLDFLETTLPDSKCVNGLGVKVDTSKWLSFHEGFRCCLDKELSTRGMILGQVCMKTGVIKCIEDLFTNALDEIPADDAEAFSLSAGPSKRQAAKDAKSKFDDLRKKMNHTLAAAARVSCDEDTVNGIRIVALGTGAEEQEFGSMMKNLKGAEESVEFYWDRSQWGYLRACKKTLECLTDVTALSHCGFTVNFPAAFMAQNTTQISRRVRTTQISPRVRYEDQLANKLLRLVTHLISNRVGSHLVNTHSYPGKLAGILREATAELTMKEFRKDVAAWHAAKDASRLSVNITCIVVPCFPVKLFF